MSCVLAAGGGAVALFGAVIDVEKLPLMSLGLDSVLVCTFYGRTWTAVIDVSKQRITQDLNLSLEDVNQVHKSSSLGLAPGTHAGGAVELS